MKVKQTITVLLITAFIVPFGGCTSRAWYDGFKEGAKTTVETSLRARGSVV